MDKNVPKIKYNSARHDKDTYVKKTIASLQKAVSTREKAIEFYKKVGALDKKGQLSKYYR